MNIFHKFRKANIIVAWIVFVLSFILYISTLEPTVSYWDCGEFISCAVNLEVPHAPGAPLFILLGKVASLLNPTNPTIMVNGLSALASAFTIFFLFLTISWFVRKIQAKLQQNDKVYGLLSIVVSFIGSMSYAVSDSFWFSAVETEVYALSSLFTAVVFWCITKWEETPDSNLSGKWLLFIAYLFGLSIGVHLLNLLAIPAIVLVYYLKKYPPEFKVILKAIMVSVVLLLAFLIIIPGIPAILSAFELVAVNKMGMPFNSGLITGLAIIGVVLGASVYYGQKKNLNWLYYPGVYLLFVIIGLSSYGLVIIRSIDNPPIDMNNPDNPFSLEYYLNREQYGKRPLLYGQSFASPAIRTEERTTYQRFDDKYAESPLNPKVIYDKNTLMLFPRLSNDEASQVSAYKSWIGDFKGKPYYSQETGKQIQLPTFAENMKFFFKYQLGYMYFRYLMWNFVGRQNDITGHGNVIHGNWTSGISLIDNMRLGDQNKFPVHLKTNKAHNTYFFLPFILGLIGVVFHFKQDRKGFWVSFSLFFFTGIAIALYVNEVPVVPRERDYVYVGSFYVFAIWIGLGAMAIFNWIEKWIHNRQISLGIVSLVSLSIPAIMLAQNYDDHNRSGRYGVLEYARNFLESCEPNAILFTEADNNTYPLWYAQEVAGIRRDVRIVLLPYLSADWYVEQMRHPIYKQNGLPIKLSKEKYFAGKRSYLPIIERTDSAVDVNDFLDFVGSDDIRAKVELSSGDRINFIPVRNVYLKSDKNCSLSKGLSGQPRTASVPIHFKDKALLMDELVLLDILTTNNWKRPVYFASPQEPINLGLQNYLQLDGYAYKLVPIKTSSEDYNSIGIIDVEKLYKQYMVDFDFSTIEKPSVYLDYTHINTLNVISLRNKFVKLADGLLNIRDTVRAEKVMDKIVRLLPNSRLPIDLGNIEIAKCYIRMGKMDKGRTELIKIKDFCKENMVYFNSLPGQLRAGLDYEIKVVLFMLQNVAEIAFQTGDKDLVKDCRALWENAAGNYLLSEIQ